MLDIADSLRTWLEMSGGRQHRDPKSLHSEGKKGTEKEKADDTRYTFPRLQNLARACSAKVFLLSNR